MGKHGCLLAGSVAFCFFVEGLEGQGGQDARRPSKEGHPAFGSWDYHFKT